MKVYYTMFKFLDVKPTGYAARRCFKAAEGSNLTNSRLTMCFDDSGLRSGKAYKIVFNRHVLIPEADKLVGSNLTDDLDIVENLRGLVQKLHSKNQ